LLLAFSHSAIEKRSSMAATPSLSARPKSCLVLLALLVTLSGGVSAQDVVAKQPRRLAIEGHCTWPFNINTATVSLNVPKIVYRRPGYTGTLKLMLWASKTPYKPGTRGWTIAESKLGPLKENQTYSNLARVCKITRPPTGKYYLALLLTEFSDGEYRTQHYAAGNKLTAFE
jgi:hypothetical protein